jgi:protein SDA1
VKALQHRREINKKTRSAEKRLRKTLKSVKKVAGYLPSQPHVSLILRSQKRSEKQNANTPNFPALQLLHDPQTFSERLYDMLVRYDKRLSLDHKILIMQLLSRVICAHKLCVLGFYTYILKYLTYHQLRVPAILVALAQAVHDFIPPDAITPVIHKLAQEFVHPGVGSEVIAAGLNAIREVCRRQPWAMEEDLLGDLVEYRKSREKSVTAAARGLLQLYREVNPEMLKRRERVRSSQVFPTILVLIEHLQGKDASMGMSNGFRPLPFGHSADAAVDIEGLAVGSMMPPTVTIISIFLFSFLKITSRSSMKRKASMSETQATGKPGQGGSSTPTPQMANLRMKDGSTWILMVAI